MEENKINFSEEVNQELKIMGTLYNSIVPIFEELQDRKKRVKDLVKDQIKNNKEETLVLGALEDRLIEEIGEETLNKLAEIGL